MIANRIRGEYSPTSRSQHWVAEERLFSPGFCEAKVAEVQTAMTQEAGFHWYMEPSGYFLFHTETPLTKKLQLYKAKELKKRNFLRKNGWSWFGDPNCQTRPPSFVRRSWKRSKRNGAVSHSSRCKVRRYKGTAQGGGAELLGKFPCKDFCQVWLEVVGTLSWKYDSRWRWWWWWWWWWWMLFVNEVKDIEHGFQKWRKFVWGCACMCDSRETARHDTPASGRGNWTQNYEALRPKLKMMQEWPGRWKSLDFLHSGRKFFTTFPCLLLVVWLNLV